MRDQSLSHQFRLFVCGILLVLLQEVFSRFLRRKYWTKWATRIVVCYSWRFWMKQDQASFTWLADKSPTCSRSNLLYVWISGFRCICYMCSCWNSWYKHSILYFCTDVNYLYLPATISLTSIYLPDCHCRWMGSTVNTLNVLFWILPLLIAQTHLKSLVYSVCY